MTTAARVWLLVAAFLVGKYVTRLVLRGDVWHIRLRVLRWWHGAHTSCAWCGGQYGVTNRDALSSPFFNVLVASSLRVCMKCRQADRWERMHTDYLALVDAERALNVARKPKSLFCPPEGGTLTIKANAKPLYKR